MQILNIYHTGYPDLDGVGAAFVTVLTRSVGDDSFAVYSGIVRLPDAFEGSAAEYNAARVAAAGRVASNGNKEPFERAVTYFPGLKREEYRV